MSGGAVGRICGMLVVTLVAAACESTTVLSNDAQVGAVVTLVDSTGGLSTARTFVLVDTVMTIPASATSISQDAARDIIAAIRTHFIALGWTDLRGTAATRPDVLVLVAASTQIRSGLIYSDWFSAWGYLPYWGAGVDPSLAWSMSGTAVPYVYQAGTLVVTMLDVRFPRDNTKPIPLLWAAGLDGMVGDPSTDARVRAGIDQAFAQSPYLRVR